MKPKDMTGWVVKYSYGQFRTASSVAFRLRRRGYQAWAVQRPDGNCVVLVPPEQEKKGAS